MDRIEKKPNGIVEVTLQEPVTHDGKTYSTVRFRPLSFGDLKALGNEKDQSEVAMAHWMCHRLSDLPIQAFDKISGNDLEVCIEAVTDFFPKSPKT